MYKIEFNYKPNPRKAPCHKGVLCKHHRETLGKCKNTCSDYKLFEKEKAKRYAEKEKNYLYEEHHRQVLDKNFKVYKG